MSLIITEPYDPMLDVISEFKIGGNSSISNATFDYAVGPLDKCLKGEILVSFNSSFSNGLVHSNVSFGMCMIKIRE